MSQATTTRADRIARIETELWEAYYERQWPREFRLLVAMHREFMGMSLTTAVRASYLAARAAIAFAPLDASDVDKARRFLVRYYVIVRRVLVCVAEADDLAGREMHYWVTHRAVARRRLAEVAAGRPVDDPDLSEIAPVSDAFARLHAGLFNATPAAMRESGIARAQAAAVVDRISGGYSPDVAGDWARVELYLRQAYRAIETVTQAGEKTQYKEMSR